MKDVSIIIPIYNVEKYVAECINSVISQTYDHSKIECIIVDDCSPDRSMDIVNEIISNYNGEMTFITQRHEANRGLSASRNTGLDIASGKFIYFIDSDDYIFDNTLALLMKAYGQYPDAEIITGNAFDEQHNYNLLKSNATKSFKNTNNLLLGENWILTAWNSLVKKELIDRRCLRFMEGIYFEDNLWNYNLLPYASKVVTIPDVTYFYRKNEGGIMLAARREKVEKCCKDYITILQNFMETLDRPAFVGKSVRSFTMLINTIDYLMSNKSQISSFNHYEMELKKIRSQIFHTMMRKKRPFLALMTLMSFYPLLNLRKARWYRHHYNIIHTFFWKPALVVDNIYSFISR